MIADPFDDSRRAAVSDGETFSGHAAEISFTTRRAIQSDIADNDVFLRPIIDSGRVADNNAPAGQPFADIIVGVTVNADRHSRRQKRNEREVLKLLQEESTQRKGFELIVAQYSEQLYWQIRRMVLSHEDANDLLQNTFIKAWTNIDYFRAEAKLSTWLYRIALNECLTFLNRQRATTTVAIDDPEAAIVQKLESDPYYSGDQVQMLLQKALLTLPEKQRMVFNLKYYQEMKYEEMSEIFGTSVGALKASYHHAVKKIEKFLEEVD